MTVAAIDLYCEPAVCLDLHVPAVNGLICNCRYSQLTPRTTPIFCPWLSRRGPCSISLDLVYPICSEQRLICGMRAALICVLRKFASGIQRNLENWPSPICNSKCACDYNQLSNCETNHRSCYSLQWGFY